MTPILEWAYASLTLPGQAECGDMQLVCDSVEGALIAVVDGLGHGEEAAAAAQAAVRSLGRNANESVISILKHCHEDLRHTRGVVLTVASFNSRDETMTWLGVGNVDGQLFHTEPGAEPTSEAILLRGGVVGYNLPKLAASLISITPGDTVILTTDGVQNGYHLDLNLNESPQKIADNILARSAKGTDDALVLVAKYLGSATGQL